MTQQSLTNSLLEVLEAERLEEDALAQQAPPDQTVSGNYENWTLKDVLAHSATWKLRTASRLLNWLAGLDLPAEEELETTNRAIYETCKIYSWSEVVDLLTEAHQRMIRAASSVSEEDLLRPRPNGSPFWAALFSNGVWHPLYHITGWLFERGQRDRALAVLEDFNRRMSALPPEPGVHALAAYDHGILLLKAGARTKALDRLQQAFALSPRLHEWARQDPDLEDVRADLYPG